MENHYISKHHSRVLHLIVCIYIQSRIVFHFPRNNPREAISISMASSLSPPEIPMELHAQNRARVVQSLRENLLSSSRPLHGFVFLQVIPPLNSLIAQKVSTFLIEWRWPFSISSLGRRRADTILHGSCHTLQVIQNPRFVFWFSLHLSFIFSYDISFYVLHVFFLLFFFCSMWDLSSVI